MGEIEFDCRRWFFFRGTFIWFDVILTAWMLYASVWMCVCIFLLEWTLTILWYTFFMFEILTYGEAVVIRLDFTRRVIIFTFSAFAGVRRILVVNAQNTQTWMWERFCYMGNVFLGYVVYKCDTQWDDWIEVKNKTDMWMLMWKMFCCMVNDFLGSVSINMCRVVICPNKDETRYTR